MGNDVFVAFPTYHPWVVSQGSVVGRRGETYPWVEGIPVVILKVGVAVL